MWSFGGRPGARGHRVGDPCPRVIKSCSTQLAPVFTDIFNPSLTQWAVPKCFKMTTIVPVPKKTRGASLSDYHLWHSSCHEVSGEVSYGTQQHSHTILTPDFLQSKHVSGRVNYSVVSGQKGYLCQDAIHILQLCLPGLHTTPFYLEHCSP